LIRSLKELPTAVRERIRGGIGRAWQQDVLAPGDMAGVVGMSHLTIEPGSTIAEHTHRGSEELYLVLSGNGVGTLDGERSPVAAGSFWVVRDGHSHGLECAAQAPLELLTLLTSTHPPRPDGGNDDRA
jgi:quercetin dioxygenase-like cupin family protein